MGKARLAKYGGYRWPTWRVEIPGIVDHIFSTFEEARSWGWKRNWRGLHG
jgi:hypothetical protein